jgi:DNA (cytosine-5)-methyltransferase 1
MNVLSLFSGIGGLDLGIRLACPAARVVCYVERDAYCQRVVMARIADGLLDAAPLWPDVCSFDGRRWAGCVDTICGGFPCVDISLAGRRAGIQPGNRSGLWYEFARIIGEVGPRYVFMENVAALVNGGLDIVLGTLANLGYDSEWGVVSAADVGAPHLRKRVFLLAYRELEREPQGDVGEPAIPGLEERRGQCGDVGEELAPALGTGCFPPGPGDAAGWREFLARFPEAEPSIRGDAPRTPHRMDRLKALGNSCVQEQVALAWSILWQRMEDQ